MKSPERSPGWAPAAAVFAAAAFVLIWFHGNYLVFSLAEGILLDALAARTFVKILPPAAGLAVFA